MAILSIQDLENGKIDLDTWAAIVNANDLVVATRLNGNVNTWFGLQAALSAATGRVFFTKAQMDAAPGTMQWQAARVSDDTTVANNGLYIWSGSAWVKTKDPWEPYVTMARKNGYVLLGGPIHYYLNKPKGVWVVTHGRMTMFRGTGPDSLVNIEAVTKLEVPLNAAYAVNLEGVAGGQLITGQVYSNFAASPNAAGSFVDDLKIILLGYRTYGIGGLLVKNPAGESNNWTARMPVWHRTSNSVVSWNQTTRTLTTPQMVANSLFAGSRYVLVISAGTFTFPSSANYQVLWLDTRSIDPNGSGATDPSTIFKIGAYAGYPTEAGFEDAYVGAPYQIPIFVYSPWGSRPAPGFFENVISGVSYPVDLTAVNASIAATNSAVAALSVRMEDLEQSTGGGGETPTNALSLEDGKIYESGAVGKTLISDISPNMYIANPQWRSKAVLSLTDKPSLGLTTPVLVARDGSLILPSADNLLTIYCSYGQSNSVGSTGIPLDPITVQTPYPNTLLKLSGVDMRLGYIMTNDVVNDLSGVTTFEPMISTTNATSGTTVCEGAMRHMGLVADSKLAYDPTYLAFAPGKGSTPIAGLTRGSIPYTNFMNGIIKTKEIADARGLHCWLPAVWWVAGEGDAANVNYVADMIALLDQIDEDVKAITGQIADVQMIVRQHSSFYSSTDGVLGLYEVTKADPRFHLAYADYFNTFSDDLLHNDSTGHFRGGEYFGKATYAALFGDGWKPVSPISVTRVDSYTLDILMNVPVAPLVIDTVNGSAKNGAAQGFEITSNGAKTITDVQIINGNTVRLIMTEPMGSTGNVRYAMTGQTSPRTVEGIPRGTLRDSDTAPRIIDGLPGYNWCVHFREIF